MSKKKKSTWPCINDMPDMPIPTYHCVSRKTELNFEFTFTVKEKYKEIFKRISQAVEDNYCLGFLDKNKIMTHLICNINFDTNKVNNNAFYNSRYDKKSLKHTKKSLKGKRDGKENILEKENARVFEFDIKNWYEDINVIRSFNSLSPGFSVIQVTSIYERNNEVYCLLMMTYNQYLKPFEMVGNFLGTFADTSKEIDICLIESENVVPVMDTRLLSTKFENNSIEVDLSQIKNSEHKLKEKETIQLIDLTEIWKVKARIGLKDELQELVKAVNNLTETMESEGFMSKTERIKIELSLLLYNTDIVSKFIQDEVTMYCDIDLLRDYQKERLLKGITNTKAAEALNMSRWEPDFEELLSKIMNVSTVGFNIDNKVEWVFEADIAGMTSNELRSCFEDLLKNSNVNEIEIKLKE